MIKLTKANRAGIARQFSWVSIGNIVAAGLRAVSLVLVARSTAPAEFGLLSAVVGIGIVLQSVFDLGLSPLVIRERARAGRDDLVVSALRLNTRLSAALAGIFLAGLALLGLLANQEFLLMTPLCLSVSGEKNADTWLGIAIADGNAKINSMNLVSRRTLSLALLAVGLALGLDAIAAVSAAEGLAGLASAGFAHSYVRTLLSQRSRVPWREIARSGASFWANSMAMQIRNLDVTIVSLVGSPIEAGFYSTASRLITPLQILPRSLAVVMLPTAARGGRRRLLVGLVSASSALMAVASLGLAAITPTIVPLVLGRAYEPASPALQIVILSLPFASFSALMTATLQGWGRGRFVAFVAASTTAVCLVGVSLGTLHSGAIGAAKGVCAAYVVQAVLLAWEAHRCRGSGGESARSSRLDEACLGESPKSPESERR